MTERTGRDELGSECVVFMCATCEATGLSQQERAPRHEEEQSCFQQLEVPQFGELCHVQTTVKGFNKMNSE